MAERDDEPRARSSNQRPERPLYCGNFEYDATEKEITRLFERYGQVDKIDLKTGFAFVYMMDKRDGEDAIKDLDGREFGYKRRKLRIEWASQKEADRKHDNRPSKTLFVVNFDVRNTGERDIEDHFSPYGRLARVEIKKNYAFVQYATQEEAAKAFLKTNQTVVNGRTITVEYTQNEDPHAKLQTAGGGRGGSRSRSPRRSRSPPRGRRSPSPIRRRSPSPLQPRRRSPSPRRRGGRSPSPPRGGAGGRRSPSPPRRGGRSPSPPRRGRSPAVAPRRDRSRSPSYTRKRSSSR